MCAVLAAVTASLTRTVESAQITSMPLMLASMVGSGIAVPLEVMPDRAVTVLELLPLTPVMTLVRGGWTGDLSAYETIGPLMTALAWTALGAVAAAVVPVGTAALRNADGSTGMRGPGRWWRRKSTPAKVETYTRSTFHFP